MRVSIRSDTCLALRLIATQEHYRKTQDWLAMLPELQQRTSIIVQSQSIIETQAAEITRLRAENEKLRSALRLIFLCGVQQEDVLSNKYKIVIPEYVLSEVEGLMNEAMGKRDE